MCFRPLIGLSLATAALFTLLVGLGVWQLERLQWKLALIATAHRNIESPPMSLAEVLREKDPQYHHVALWGRFENDKEAFVFTTDAGEPVYHLLVPFQTHEGILLIDRGVIPLALRAAATRRAGQIEGPTHLVGVWRTPDGPGLFTARPDLSHRVWFSRDVTDIARRDAISLVASVVVEADGTPNPGGWPRGGQTQINFRNEHLQYAITWFALAAGLLGVYIAYHVSKGRLRFGR